jgi:hypothetical protein
MGPMRMKYLTLPLLTICAVASAQGAVPNAKDLVRAALDAQGGEQTLRALTSVQWEASGYRNELEQSERPEGPYIVQMNDISEIHDVKSHRYRYQQTSSLYPVARFTTVPLWRITLRCEQCCLPHPRGRLCRVPNQELCNRCRQRRSAWR